jgi:hypothetical protein
MGKRFQRNKEDFICENCKESVKGNGYTNHCPNCLWSKHVDNFPGDRESKCKSLMKPVKVDVISGDYILIFECTKCNEKKRNRTADNDNQDKILSLLKP